MYLCVYACIYAKMLIIRRLHVHWDLKCRQKQMWFSFERNVYSLCNNMYLENLIYRVN